MGLASTDVVMQLMQLSQPLWGLIGLSINSIFFASSFALVSLLHSRVCSGGRTEIAQGGQTGGMSN